MRGIRRFTQLLLTVLGGLIVLYAVMRVDAFRERALITILGLLIMEVGIWQVASFLFPNHREYKPLRKETDYFLRLVRRLNRAAVAAQQGSTNAIDEMDRVEEEMHHSIGRMRRLAGLTDETTGLTATLQKSNVA
jgi:hypothetical protein